MLNQINPQKNDVLDISEVSYIQRISIGSATRTLSEEEKEAQMERLNRCLGGVPRGRIINKEITTVMGRPNGENGDMMVLFQQITYHVGFKRKPYWIDELLPS